MKKYKKNSVLKIFVLVLITIIFIILMKQPEMIGYPYSMGDVGVKKETFESLNMQVLQEQEMLRSAQSQYISISKEYNLKQQNSDEISKNLDMVNIDLHIPSLLLVLEEQAVKNDLNIHIRYAEKKIISNDVYSIDGSEIMENGTGEGSNIEEITDEPIVIEPESTIEKTSLANDTYIPPIDGVNILVLPVEIEGKYTDMRNYLKFLDTMDFIIPYSANVETQGDYIIGELIVQIFYEGVN